MDLAPTFSPEPVQETVTIAILAKDKAHCLPLYLQCILAQTFPKERTNLYIRTNNNTDTTTEVLANWLQQHQHLYREVYFDSSSVEDKVEEYQPHEWNATRFCVLGRIRQDSVTWAQAKNSHYFVADCDNFIHPQTIEALLKTQCPVVGPLLLTGATAYSNYHHQTDANGYFQTNPEYFSLWSRRVQGLIVVDVIHCTYLIRDTYLKQVSYLPDGTNRHEYVIFSENLRRAGITQYLDNRHIYGRLTFADTLAEFNQEPWLDEFTV